MPEPSDGATPPHRSPAGATDDKEGDRGRRGWSEGRPREVAGVLDVPGTGSRATPRGPAGGHMVRHDQVRRLQRASRRQQAAQQRGRDGEGWVGHHPERLSGKVEIGGIGLDDPHRGTGEAVAEVPSAAGMELDGDDPRPRVNQGGGQRPVTGPHVDDQIARADAGPTHQRRRGAVIEAVPPPPRRPGRGHDAPSP